MASFRAVRRASRNLGNIVDRYKEEEKSGQQDIKDKYNLDDRLTALEGLRKSAYDTEKLIRDLPKNVQNRTRGRLVTAGQKNRITASEQNPLAYQLADISRGRGAEQEGVNLVNSLVDDFLSNSGQNFVRDYQAGILKRDNAMTKWQADTESERIASQLAQQAALAREARRAQNRAAKKAREWQMKILNTQMGRDANGNPINNGEQTVVRVGDQANDGSLGGQVKKLAKGYAGGMANIADSLSQPVAQEFNRLFPNVSRQLDKSVASDPFLNDLTLRTGDFYNWATGNRKYAGYQ